jgi:D-alanyl-D-alanine carboxypeptidase
MKPGVPLLIAAVLWALACSKSAQSPAASPDTAGGTTDSAVSPGADSTADTASLVDDLDALLEPVRAANDLPSLTAAVFDDHGLLAIGAVGVRKLGDPTPVTKSDVWHLGSDTKAMTATLTAMLVEDGVVKWTTTMAQAFPEWASTMDPGYKDVTLEMLLAHRGGAPAAVPSDIWSEMWKPGVSAEQRKVAVQAMLSRPPETPPGTKFVYANAGYMMVGAALEHATGKTWEAMTSDRIFARLAMTSCGYGFVGTVGMVDAPWGHTMKGTTLTPVPPGPQADNPPSLGPAGTVHCGLADWGKFLQVHLVGANGGATIVSAPSITKLQTPVGGGDYALGWGVAPRSWAGGTTLSHSGSNTMNYATVWIAPAKNRILVAATNRGDDVAAKGVDSAFGPLIERYLK